MTVARPATGIRPPVREYAEGLMTAPDLSKEYEQ
jgi:hypothetical protein